MNSYLNSKRISEAPYTTLTKLLEKWGTIQPETEAVVCHSYNENRTSITYGNLYKEAVKLAKGLICLGIKKGDYVGIGGDNTSEWMVATYGVLFAGAHPVNFPFHDKAGEGIKRRLTLIGRCAAILFDPGHNDSHWDIIQKITQVDPKTGTVLRSDIPSLKWVLPYLPMQSAGLSISTTDISRDDNTELPEIDPEDTAAVLQTSGSTGYPKVVEKSHFEIIKYGEAYAYLLDLNFKKSNGTIYYCDRPFYWLAGYPGFDMVIGATRVTQKSTLALSSYTEIVSFTITVIHREKPQCGLFIAPFYQEMAISKHFHWKFRSLIVTGQPISQTIFKDMGEKFDSISALYGSTEGGMIAGKLYHVSDFKESKDVGMIPLAGYELKIVGKDGFVLPILSQGELYIRSSTQFKGYLNDPEKTAAVLTSSGWFKTDDFCRINAEGHLEVLGRVSDVLEIAGCKTTPSFIEEFIKNHPDVLEVTVFAIKKDDKMDDIPCAAVVKRAGTTLTEESIRKFIRQQLDVTEEAKFFENIYVPKHILFYESLPRTTTGKYDRKVIKDISIQKIGGIDK